MAERERRPVELPIQMTIWLTSDPHLGHENLARVFTFGGADRHPARTHPDRGDRFKSAQEMNEVIIERWIEVVKPEDHIYVLGDLTFGKGFLPIFSKLPGHKRLILGNHDRFDVKLYREAGFQKIMAIRRMGDVWLTHMPIHPDCMGSAIGNIHGHTHANRIDDPRYLNVCVEMTDYRPLPFDACRARLGRA